MNKLKTVLKDFNYRSIIGFKLYYFSLITLAVGLPLSPFVTSMAQFWLALNWIIEGQFKRKWHAIKTEKLFWFILILPLVHLIWLINTSDFNYAINDLKIKVPLLILPLIIGTSDQLNAKQIGKLMWLFTWALFAGSLISTGVYLGFGNIEVNDIRNISIFISHIRFSLMIVFAISFLIWNLWKNNSHITIRWKLISIILICWFIVFLGILRSMTSWVILVTLFYGMLWLNHKNIKNIALKRAIIISAIALPLILTLFVRAVYIDYNSIKPINFSELPSHTPRGNKYFNDTLKTTTERGYYYNILISWKELEKGWSQISDVPYNSLDKNGYSTKHKLVRYLTSLGLPKDLDGIKQLDKKDIKLIEDGYASSIYKVSFTPYIKMYESIYDLDHYFKTGNANNKSISMRVEFVKTGIYIIKNNFWLGVGTGDVKNSYKNTYQEINSKLSEKNRLRSHNQYLTFFVAFGFVGFVFCLISMFGPLFYISGKSSLFIAFALIQLISMFNEDTLETQAGVTFYILFYSLLVFNNKKIQL